MDPLKTLNPKREGITCTGNAIMHCVDAFQAYNFLQSSTGVPNYNLVLTDGHSSGGKLCPVHLTTAIGAAQKANITNLVIGVGPDVKEKELDDLAGKHGKAFSVLNAIELHNKIEQILHSSCNAVQKAVVGEVITDSILKGQKRIISLIFPEPGMEIAISTGIGATEGYWAWDFEEPSPAVYDGIISNGVGYIPHKQHRTPRHTKEDEKSNLSKESRVFISIVGLAAQNTYTFQARSRRARIWLSVCYFSSDRSCTSGTSSLQQYFQKQVHHIIFVFMTWVAADIIRSKLIV
ncbi:uncharacterized protein LOC129587776 [Paramacrobiotus metropolitanus]|uniref:uncharacterized protein LOC129587776 n=1 Tax=Paramacrobiotus metropolitanus TaxID=2943436 RepID=UPI002445BDF7|nr:uncharacterized protein LOC129587776 [Paramacrobiotus metropolitanus]XP_055337660.1 uncharacterized protein LOC129587776 [Paramacrobiotus metropolitanus]XP_055337661.1 uncharacterized protein LOC129587776 [Paramacrobiotus metropolitanus]